MEYREAEYDRSYRFYARPDRPGVASIHLAALRKHVVLIREADRHAFIVFFPHWGQSYRWKDEAQTITAHGAIDSGVDLVLGHGAHMLQEIEHYKGRWIVYSLGDSAFNAAGRFAKNQVDPFSLPAILDVCDQGGRTSVSLELHPIFSDNMLTSYRPRLLTQEEFVKATAFRYSRSPRSASWGSGATAVTEENRRYLRLALK